MSKDKWPYVTKSALCAICGRPDWCQISPDETTARCKRNENTERGKDFGLDKLNDSLQREHGRGGFFRLVNSDQYTSTALLTRARPAAKATIAATPSIDWGALATSCVTAHTSQHLEFLASSLGLNPDSLWRLDVGWHRTKNVWTFPMRDAALQCIGIRTRDTIGGKKAIFGSRGGLFIPRGLRNDRLYICEGPTDTAALLDLHLNAIGRESCSGGVPLIVELLNERRYEEAVIVSQRDEAKPRVKGRPELGVWYPGQDGAGKLASVARDYCPDVRVIMPPIGIKDARAWKKQGATAADLEQAVVESEARRTSVVICIRNRKGNGVCHTKKI